MKAIAFIGIAVVVIAIGISVSMASDWLEVRRLKRYLKDVADGKRPPPNMENPNRGRIEISDGGFQFADANRNITYLKWSDVHELVAFKRDIFTTDLICLGIRFGKDQWIEIDEEMTGFKIFIDAMSIHFNLREPAWWSKVAFPAFKTNTTTLWKETERDPTRP